jgi:diacylglycerol O-acyltransferase / wax synthase
MKRLTGLDAAFLSLEVRRAPMHVASVIVLDPSQVPGGVGLPQLKSLYEQRLHLAPPFRRRLAEVPFGIHHPIWIEDPEFDLDYHLRRIGCPPPGTMSELADLTGRLVALPLDRKRPLWEVWLVDGLEGGNVAVITKVHHAAIDGASGEELMIAILDLAPEIEDKPVVGEPWKPDRIPTDTELFGYAAWSLAQSPVKLFKATRRTLTAALRIRQGNRRAEAKPPPTPFTAPRTSLNHPLTPHRRVVTATLSLPEVKAIKNAFGVTVNDVILTLCGGALRHYLDGLGEVPDRALVAMVPVSVRTQDKKGAMGNEVSGMLTTLATDLDDPIERLRTVSAGMSRSKEQQNAIGAETLQNWSEFAAPALLGRAARLYSRMNVAGIHRPLFNVVISNVPGPPFPLYLAGALVKAVHPIGPIYDGAGVNITVMSYLESLDFGINTCPELLPEAWRLADGLHKAVDELTKAAEGLLAGEAPAEPEEPGEPEPVAEEVAEAGPVAETEPEVAMGEPAAVPEPDTVTSVEEPEAPADPEPAAPTQPKAKARKATKAQSPQARGGAGRTAAAAPARKRAPTKRSAGGG